MKTSVIHYSKCWKDRNEIASNPQKKRERTIKWYENFVSKYESCECRTLRNYVKNRPTKVEIIGTENIQAWIIGAQELKKNARTIEANDIRQFFQRTNNTATTKNSIADKNCDTEMSSG